VDFVIKAQPSSTSVVVPAPEAKPEPKPKPHHTGKRAPKHHKKSK